MVTTSQLLRNARQRPKYRPRLRALAGAPHRRGVIYKLTIMTPRKPNSAKRKIAKVRVLFNQLRVFANIPGMGHNLHEFSVVMVRGGSAKDLPGVNYTLMKGMLDFSSFEIFNRKAGRSKYGITLKQSLNIEDV
jgi:small subunit ribosomal protein S12